MTILGFVIYIRGGFYIDCDEIFLNEDISYLFTDNLLKIQPLCYNIERNEMVSVEEFLSQPYDSNNIYYFNNNPIIAPPKHTLIYQALLNATKKLLLNYEIHDIQSTTGPGNLSSALVSYLFDKQNEIKIIRKWDKISKTPWHLNYRKDDRNWRLYDGKKNKWFS